MFTCALMLNATHQIFNHLYCNAKQQFILYQTHNSLFLALQTLLAWCTAHKVFPYKRLKLSEERYAEF